MRTENIIHRFLDWLRPRWFAAYWHLSYHYEMARATGIPHYALLCWIEYRVKPFLPSLYSRS